MNEERPVEGLEELKAPRLSAEQLLRFKETVVARAEMALARRRRPASSWDVLARWARPGLVAAAVALVFLAVALRVGGVGDEAANGPVALDEVLRYTAEDESVPAVLLTSSEPDADAVVAAALARDYGGRQRGTDEVMRDER